jgi:hypothetical protein
MARLRKNKTTTKEPLRVDSATKSVMRGNTVISQHPTLNEAYVALQKAKKAEAAAALRAATAPAAKATTTTTTTPPLRIDSNGAPPMKTSAFKAAGSVFLGIAEKESQGMMTKLAIIASVLAVAVAIFAGLAFGGRYTTHVARSGVYVVDRFTRLFGYVMNRNVGRSPRRRKNRNGPWRVRLLVDQSETPRPIRSCANRGLVCRAPGLILPIPGDGCGAAPVQVSIAQSLERNRWEFPPQRAVVANLDRCARVCHEPAAEDVEARMRLP